LLARLGLRAGEVEALKVDDIDWTAGTFTVHGKGGKVRQMPLLHGGGVLPASTLVHNTSNKL
jgi:integrase